MATIAELSALLPDVPNGAPPETESQEAFVIEAELREDRSIGVFLCLTWGPNRYVTGFEDSFTEGDVAGEPGDGEILRHAPLPDFARERDAFHRASAQLAETCGAAVKEAHDARDAAIARTEAAEAGAAANGIVDIVFDGMPGPDGPRFVEVENERQESIAFGEWVRRPDGFCALRIPAGRALIAERDALRLEVAAHLAAFERIKATEGDRVAESGRRAVAMVAEEMARLRAEVDQLCAEVTRLLHRKAAKCDADGCMGGHLMDWNVPKVNGMAGSSPCPACFGSGAVLR